MVIECNKLINSLKTALKNMDKKYYMLSRRYVTNLKNNPELLSLLNKNKYLERPFAYEFYHQLRKLTENGEVDLGGHFIQAEVDKKYQHYFESGKIPDFIIHIPNTDQNLAVIEFKLASNPTNVILKDFEKLIEFKQRLRYSYGVEVILGNKAEIAKQKEDIRTKIGIKNSGENEVIIIWFEFEDNYQKADIWEIYF